MSVKIKYKTVHLDPQQLSSIFYPDWLFHKFFILIGHFPTKKITLIGYFPAWPRPNSSRRNPVFGCLVFMLKFHTISTLFSSEKKFIRAALRASTKCGPPPVSALSPTYLQNIWQKHCPGKLSTSASAPYLNCKQVDWDNGIVNFFSALSTFSWSTLAVNQCQELVLHWRMARSEVCVGEKCPPLPLSK